MKRDVSSYVQHCMNTDTMLEPGVYSVAAPLILKRNQSLKGHSMEHTRIIYRPDEKERQK